MVAASLVAASLVAASFSFLSNAMSVFVAGLGFDSSHSPRISTEKPTLRITIATGPAANNPSSKATTRPIFCRCDSLFRRLDIALEDEELRIETDGGFSSERSLGCAAISSTSSLDSTDDCSVV